MICIDLNHKLPVWQYGKLCGVKCFKIKLARTVRDLQNTQMYIVSFSNVSQHSWKFNCIN